MDRSTILDTVRHVAPFDILPEDKLQEIVDLFEVRDYNQQKTLYEQEISKLRGVEIIVSGSFDTFFYDSERTKRKQVIQESGTIFGAISILLNQRLAIRTVIVEKNTQTLFLHRKYFRALCAEFPEFLKFFTSDFASRMLDPDFAHFYKKPAWKDDSFVEADQFYSKKISDISYRNIVAVSLEMPAFEVAKIMSENKVSCVFVKDANQKIVGYITDILLRDRVIGAQKTNETVASEIMHFGLNSINVNAQVFEAVLKMLRTHSRYLLVEDGGKYIGFMSRNRLLAEQSESPVLFIQSIKTANSDDELRQKWLEVPKIITQLLDRGIQAGIANKVVTTISDAIAIKVIERTIEIVGEPPAKFCFMVLGSEGRMEQTFKTDQDNAIIYEDKANEHREEVRAYFLDFAKRVSDSLNTIGFSYCTGGFMAQNPKWTHSLSHWKRNYEEWMADAVPETIIKFTTFFDCRYLYGDKTIMSELYSFLDKALEAPLERIFFFMAKNALQYEPPLTFFKGIKTFTKGALEVFDVKRAMTPIVDLVRVYSLKNHIHEVNTGERIKALYKAGVFKEEEYLELIQSYYLLMAMRLRHQARQIIVDKVEPDNYMQIKRFSRIEKLTITEIFKSIKNFQTRIKIDFTKEF